jgi:hypothetical protein
VVFFATVGSQELRDFLYPTPAQTPDPGHRQEKRVS